MSLIEQIKNILNRANDDFKNHRRSMNGFISCRPLEGGLRANISKCMKDVGIDPTIDEDLAMYDVDVRQGMYEFAVDQLKIKIAKAKKKGVSESEIKMLTVRVSLITSRLRRDMILYAYDEPHCLPGEFPEVRYGVASYYCAKVRGDGLYGCCLYKTAEGVKQIEYAILKSYI